MNSPDIEKLSFEEALSALEETVEALEHGQLSLEQAMAHYERGVALLRRCHQLLERAERRVMELTGVNASGEAVLRPFVLPEEETSASAPQTSEDNAVS
ncbi:MAG: exodeoxyribonuclease VII small subunit [Gemmatales bacterium]|nr:exodeoxyribonuclease VII small subunit [Gemmatales bacterium]MDW7995960.1 exodeoxyribonuclease VII small subunit [Gemmatales bacterium]